MKTKLLVLLAFLAFSALPSFAQGVPVAPMQITRAQFFNSTGQPLVAGCVTFNAAGTSTPQAIYADNTGTFQLSNPLTLDAAGEASVWLSNTAYDITAYTGVVGTPCSVSLGNQLWVERNKNVYATLTQSQNLFLNCATSDPVGVNGELSCRSDLGKMRFFFSIWDSVVTEGAAATLTNKTLTSPSIGGTVGGNANYTAPSINGIQIQNSPGTYISPAVSVFGANTLAKLNAAGAATQTTVSDTNGVIGIFLSTTPNLVQQNGTVNCVFDGATTASDYVQISSTVAGDCHDAGASYPTNGSQVIGRVLSTNGGAGTYQIILFGPEINSSFPKIAYSTLTNASGSIGSTLMATAPANGATYRFSVYGTQTSLGVACTSNTTMAVFVNWQDPNEAAPASWQMFTLTPSAANNGQLGRMILSATPPAGSTSIPYGGLFRVKAGTNINYSVTYTLGATCAPGPVYTVYPMLEQVTAN